VLDQHQLVALAVQEVHLLFLVLLFTMQAVAVAVVMDSTTREEQAAQEAVGEVVMLTLV
jgi:hypothetical protein